MRRNASIRVLAVVAICLLAGMAYYLRDLKPALIAAQLTFSRDAFEAVLSQWSPEDLRRFNQHFTADYVFLVVYGALGWLLGRRLASSKGPSVQALRWLLPAAAVFDFIENVLHQVFLAFRPGGSPEPLYVVAGTAALLKFALIFAFTALAVRAWRRKPA